MIGRGSALSLLQMEKVRDRIRSVFPDAAVELLTRSSRGDMLADIPLQGLEGTDFFTREIFDALRNNEADIAVHSLKDMSSEHFFGGHVFAVPDREDARDVLFVNRSFRARLEAGEPVRIGTCSPRRERMAKAFLRSVFTPFYPSFAVELLPLRGNVDSRLRKLTAGEYDAIILAAAGVNRLLADSSNRTQVKSYLGSLDKIFLPLVECAPAPCQGAIAVEALPDNTRAVEVLHAINQPAFYDRCVAEKKMAQSVGVGCDQRFGVWSTAVAGGTQLYIGGEDSLGQLLDRWVGLPDALAPSTHLFSSTDYMGAFFEYEFLKELLLPEATVVFVANHKAVEHPAVLDWLRRRRVWVAGTRTWKELAKKGIWVEGSADAMGMESLTDFWSSPLAGVDPKELLILTNEQAAKEWQRKGYPSLGTYRLLEKRRTELEKQIARADFIFWTSAAQYRLYQPVLKPGVRHACPSGDTARQLREAGLDPLIFPTIKAFQQWRTDSIR